MGKSCCVVNCGQNERDHPDAKFSKFPTARSKHNKRHRWKSAISRGVEQNPGALWSPTSKWTYVCNKHFISGKVFQ